VAARLLGGAQGGGLQLALLLVGVEGLKHLVFRKVRVVIRPELGFVVVLLLDALLLLDAAQSRTGEPSRARVRNQVFILDLELRQEVAPLFRNLILDLLDKFQSLLVLGLVVDLFPLVVASALLLRTDLKELRTNVLVGPLQAVTGLVFH